MPDSTGIEDTLVRGYRKLALETPARPRDVVLCAHDVLLSSLFLLISLPISHAIAALVLVTSGRFDIHVGFEIYKLAEGDSISFPSSLPHRYVNPTSRVSRAVTVILDHAPAAARV